MARKTYKVRVIRKLLFDYDADNSDDFYVTETSDFDTQHDADITFSFISKFMESESDEWILVELLEYGNELNGYIVTRSKQV